MKVRDIMQRNPYRIPATTTAEDAAKLMEQKMVGSLLIENKGKVIGIMTEGDLVRKVLAQGKDGSEIYVNEIKSYPLIQVDENTDVLDASSLLTKYTIRRLVVVSGEKIVGIISQAIIGKYLEELLEEMSE
ncbi:MAG TPA: CBS domain-containing protein [Candidatus Saccharimonadales bacterium]|nr:CBS domain-containing protein [Candidatus Saccharimonadales bacterium]